MTMVASTMIRGPRERVRGVRASSESVSLLESEHRGCRLSSCIIGGGLRCLSPLIPLPQR